MRVGTLKATIDNKKNQGVTPMRMYGRVTAMEEIDLNICNSLFACWYLTLYIYLPPPPPPPFI